MDTYDREDIAPCYQPHVGGGDSNLSTKLATVPDSHLTANIFIKDWQTESCQLFQGLQLGLAPTVDMTFWNCHLPILLFTNLDMTPMYANIHSSGLHPDFCLTMLLQLNSEPAAWVYGQQPTASEVLWILQQLG